MLHSHEALDRPGGYGRVQLLSPLRSRDFRLLFGGLCVSQVGDGIFLVAIALQAFSLSNTPSSLAAVGIAMTVPTIVLLLVGGAVSDRLDRRRIIIAADLLRCVAVAGIAVLSATGLLELWMLAGLAAVYGAGAAFFGPAFDALVPDVVDPADLPQANSLEQVLRPVALRMAGPAIGGVLIDVAGMGAAFAVDACSFAVCAAAAALIRPRRRAAARTGGAGMAREIAAGMRYVASHVWLWGTFASAAVAYLLFMGPTEVLVSFIVKNELGGSGADLGLVFAAGGVGSVGLALLVGQRGLPRRDITFMYAAWTLATLAVAGYGAASALWQLMAAAFVFNALETAGTIVWATAKQRHVPPALLGRVSSLDWLISIGLLPLSFALTGPVAAAIGTRETLLAAAVLGAIVTLGALYLPGMRAVESRTRPSWAGYGEYDEALDRVTVYGEGNATAVVERASETLPADHLARLPRVAALPHARQPAVAAAAVVAAPAG